MVIREWHTEWYRTNRHVCFFHSSISCCWILRDFIVWHSCSATLWTFAHSGWRGWASDRCAFRSCCTWWRGAVVDTDWPGLGHAWKLDHKQNVRVCRSHTSWRTWDSCKAGVNLRRNVWRSSCNDWCSSCGLGVITACRQDGNRLYHACLEWWHRGRLTLWHSRRGRHQVLCMMNSISRRVEFSSSYNCASCYSC